MSALPVAAVWIAGGVAGALTAPLLRRRRLICLVPLLAAGAVALPAGAGWGPGLTRLGGGLAAVTAVSLAFALLIAPRLTGTEILPAGIVGAASAIAVAGVSAIVWAAAVGVAVGALAVRWIAVAPGRSSLASGRVAGLGAAALVAAAPFITAGGGVSGAGTTVVGVLLAVGVASLLAITPLGGWAVGCFQGLRGIELSPWVLLLAPAVLASAGVVTSAAGDAAGDVFRRLLLAAALAAAVWSGLNGLRVPPARRYGRVFLADLALAAAAMASGQPGARGAGLLVILVHLAAAPLLLHPARGELGIPRRVAWFTVGGLPPSPAFWARLLVLETCAGAGGVPLVVAAAATAALALGCVPLWLRAEPFPVSPGRISAAATLAAWALSGVAIALAAAPQALARLLFGEL